MFGTSESNMKYPLKKKRHWKLNGWTTGLKLSIPTSRLFAQKNPHTEQTATVCAYITAHTNINATIPVSHCRTSEDIYFCYIRICQDLRLGNKRIHGSAIEAGKNSMSCWVLCMEPVTGSQGTKADSCVWESKTGLIHSCDAALPCSYANLMATAGHSPQHVVISTSRIMQPAALL